ncbi:unnamed protein product [Rhizophagus irregularis]|nr:unnamed protein product [Rhizophagus irregularis]
MTEYLTPQILSAERMEMAQCLYFVPSQVEPNIVEDPEAGVMEGCVEDSYDAKQILLKSMIAEVGEENIQEVWKITDMRPENKKHIYFVVIIDSISYLYSCMSNISRGIICRHYFRIMMTSQVAGFQIQMIPSRWYIDNQKDKDAAAETCCFVNTEAAQNFSGVVFTPNPSTVPTTVTNALRCAAKKKVKYGEVWGLARQAAQLSVELDSHNEMVGWLKQFIIRHKEIIITRNQELMERSEVQVDDNKENELQQVENPLVSRRKGRPGTKRFKSSTEKKSRTKYTCKTCGQAGHNSARCQNRNR